MSLTRRNSVNPLLGNEMFNRIIICALIASSFAACDTNYWWTRGQPPGVATLLARSDERLKDALKDYGTKRAQIVETVQLLERSLSAAVDAANSSNRGNLAQQLTTAREKFLDLEGKISIGSRAPYGELSGQLRNLIETAEDQTKPWDPGSTASTVGLFTARTFFFLANELSVPAPTWG